MSTKFRPEGRSKKYVMKTLRQNGHVSNYITSFRERDMFQLDEPLNRRVIGRMFGRAHYLTSHAPEPVYIRHAALRHYWNRKLDRRATVKYHNTHTLNRYV